MCLPIQCYSHSWHPSDGEMLLHCCNHRTNCANHGFLMTKVSVCVCVCARAFVSVGTYLFDIMNGGVVEFCRFYNGSTQLYHLSSQYFSCHLLHTNRNHFTAWHFQSNRLNIALSLMPFELWHQLFVVVDFLIDGD